MAQDGQVDTPPSAEDKKAPEASGGTVTAVAEAPVVAESKFTAEVKKPELKPGDQLPLFDLDDAIGITPVAQTTQPAAEVKPAAKPEAAAAATATAVATEEEAEKPEAKPEIDIAPIDQPAANDKAKQTATGPVANPAVNAPVAQEEEADADEPIKDTRYRSVFAGKSMGVLNEVWGVGEVSDELKEALGLSGKVKKNDKYGLDFHMPNGHVIEWHANLGGAEFIGMRKRTSKFDEEDAHAVAVTAVARGWSAINVHGNQKQKEMMWLHAKMHGLEVANFEPMYSDDPNNVRNRLAAYLAEQNDGKVIGATPVQHQMNLAAGVPDHAQTTAEDDAPETPADSAKPEAKAEGDKPATDKPATNQAATDKPATEKPAADKPAEAEAAKVETAAVETPAKPEAAAAEGTEVKSAFLAPKAETPAAKETAIDPVLASIIAEQRESLKDDPKGLESLNAFEKGVKGDGVAKDGIPPAIADAAKSAGIEIKTKEPAADPVAAAKPETDKPAPAAKKPKGRTP